jgi:hypothetical protein
MRAPVAVMRSSDAAGEVEALGDVAGVGAVDGDQVAGAVAGVAGDVAGGIGVREQAAGASWA